VDEVDEVDEGDEAEVGEIKLEDLDERCGNDETTNSSEIIGEGVKF
jgi:hypothetical protein